MPDRGRARSRHRPSRRREALPCDRSIVFPASADAEEEVVVRSVVALAAALAVALFASRVLADEVPAVEPVAYAAPAPLPAPMDFAPPGVAVLPPVTFGPAVSDGRDTAAPVSPKRDSGFALDVGFGTEAPISVGGVVTAELPGRLLLQVGAGFMPRGYVSAIDRLLTAVKAYDQNVSTIVRGSLGNSFVLRASGGWRPFSGHGLEIMGGYTLMTMGGETTAADVINAVLSDGNASAQLPASMNADIPLAATLHNVHVSLGWRWLTAEDHLVIRFSLSYLQTLASKVSVDLSGMGSSAAAMEGAVNTALNGYLGPYFTTYAKTPTVGLSAAYRF